jgi:hypothetical protein
MKKYVWASLIILEISIMTACSSQARFASASTNTPKPISTFQPSNTATPLPTITLWPTLSLPALPPLPKGIFDPFRESIYDPTSVQKADEIVKTAFGIVHQDSVVEEKIFVDSTMGDVVFSLFWEEGDLDLTLIQPDGNEINSSNSKPVGNFFGSLTNDPSYFISSISDSGRKKYYIFVPQIGTWIMRISGETVPAEGSNYMIQVTSMTATGLYTGLYNIEEYNVLEKKKYSSGDPITLSFGITDSVSGSLQTEPEYIHGVSMKITVEDPANNLYPLELFDDGLHKDGKKDDGVYANTFNKTSLSGKYNFYLQISGKNNRASEPFTREYFFSVDVE